VGQDEQDKNKIFWIYYEIFLTKQSKIISNYSATKTPNLKGITTVYDFNIINLNMADTIYLG